MSGAANNPYKQEAPDKTLSVEGVAADAKAVGDALIKIARFDYQITMKEVYAYVDTKKDLDELKPAKVLAIVPVITAPFIGINHTQCVMLRGEFPNPQVCVYAPDGGTGTVTIYVLYAVKARLEGV